jgi:transcriptional regulator with XRE-family HTH domain
MDQQQIIADIESRAKQARLTIAELCGHAGLHPTTFSRWKKSDRNPNPIGATLASLGKLNDVLDAAERGELKEAAPVSTAETDKPEWPVASADNGDETIGGAEADSPGPFPDGSAAEVSPPTSSSTCPSCGGSESPLPPRSSTGLEMSEAAE